MWAALFHQWWESARVVAAIVAAKIVISVVQSAPDAVIVRRVLSLATQPEVRRRVESSVADLHDTIRLVRQAIFGLENRLDHLGLRQQVLRLCTGVSPVPEINFTGPVDDALPAEVADQLIDMLRPALGSTGMHTGPASIRVEAGESLSASVTGTGRDPAGLEPAGPARPRGRHRDEGPRPARRTALTDGHAPGSGWG